VKLRDLVGQLPKRSTSPEVQSLVASLASIFRRVTDVSVMRGSWTPSVSSSAGTITSASATGRFTKIDDTTFFSVTITITTNGTGSGTLRFTLPSTPNEANVASGRETLVTGKAVTASINASTTLVGVQFYDNAYPGGDGYVISISGFYV
jgi:hypothetical protein